VNITLMNNEFDMERH